METRNYGGRTAWLVLEQFASLTSVFSSQLWLLKMQPAGKGRLPGRPPQATWNCKEEWSGNGERAKAKSSGDQQLVLWLNSFSPALFALVDLRLGELQILGKALVLQNINEEAL